MGRYGSYVCIFDSSANNIKSKDITIIIRTIWSSLFPENLERVDFIIEVVDEQDNTSSDEMDDQENTVCDLSLVVVGKSRTSTDQCHFIDNLFSSRLLKNKEDLLS